jgi:hypothetical protein
MGTSAVELICNSCFLMPAAARGAVRPEMSEIIVCTHIDVGASPAERETGVPSLRCSQCGGKVRLDRHHLTWYGL